MSQPTQVDLLELDIDLRLRLLWQETEDVQVWDIEKVAAFMRAAYGKGYTDALVEPDFGALYRDHGYRMPERTRAL